MQGSGSAARQNPPSRPSDLGARAATRTEPANDDGRRLPRDNVGATLEGVAAKHDWKLRVFRLGGCRGPDLHYANERTRAPKQTVTPSTTLR